jgi:hypothetical protein
MSLGIDCGGQVVSDAVTGALECRTTDGSNAPLAFTITPAFDVSQLDPAQLTSYFTWGWAIVAMGWAIGYGIKVAIKFLWQS